MGRLSSIVTGKFVAFDSAPLICYLEQHTQYGPLTEDLFGAVDGGDSLAMTSVITLLEVLVRPIRSGLIELTHQYREVLGASKGVSLFPVVTEICERSARLRARYAWIRTPDAIQVATALHHGAECGPPRDPGMEMPAPG